MKQVLLGGSNAALSTASSARYNFISFGGNGNVADWDQQENDQQVPVPAAGTFRNLRVETEAAPGAGTSYQFTVRKNGVATTLTVTISGTNTAAVDTANSFTVVAGDEIALECIAASTPTVTIARWSVEWEGDTADDSVLMGGGGDITGGISNAGVRNYASLVGGQITATDTLNTRALVPLNGTIKSFYVSLGTAPGAGATWEFSIYKNGAVETSTIISIADAATTANVTGLTIDIAPQDELTLSFISTAGTPTIGPVSWGVMMQPDIQGQSILAGQATGFNTALASHVFLVMHGNSFDDPTESERTNIAGPTSFDLKHFYIKLSAAPGAGNSWDFILRKEAVDTALAIHIDNPGTIGSDTTDIISVVDGEELTIKSVPTSSPTAAGNTAYAMIQAIDEVIPPASVPPEISITNTMIY